MLSTLVLMNIKPTAYIMSKNMKIDEDMIGQHGEVNEGEDIDPSHQRMRQIAMKNEKSDAKRRLFDLDFVSHTETYTKSILVDELFEREEDQAADNLKRRDAKDQKAPRVKHSEVRGRPSKTPLPQCCRSPLLERRSIVKRAANFSHQVTK